MIRIDTIKSLPSFPLWVIPGAVFTAITFGYIVLKIAGCHYFLWVHILWPISALLFFLMLARKNTPLGSTARVIGITLAIILTVAAAGKAVLFTESVSANKKIIFVAEFTDRFFLTIAGSAGPMIYEYQNFIWYGPSLGRWRDYYQDYREYMIYMNDVINVDDVRYVFHMDYEDYLENFASRDPQNN